MERTANRSKYILILLCISVSGLLVDAMPPELPPSRLYEVIGKFMSVPHLGLIWWFGLSLLDDKFRIDWLAWCGMGITTAMLMFVYLSDVGLLPRPGTAFGYISLLIELALVVHIMWTCFSGFRDDLINARRVLRLWIAVLPAGVLLVVIVASFTVENPYVIKLMRVAMVLAVASFWLFWLARFQTAQLVFSPILSEAPATPEIKPQDQAAHARLIQIVKEEKAYLDPDLTVGGLAERVEIPAHQLRALINRELGYRNFSQFLAKYRIADLKVALADPELARVPILTLALNGGFSSLSTFNRTFRAETGQSAGEFRKAALGNTAQS